jgi:hypothetical protein
MLRNRDPKKLVDEIMSKWGEKELRFLCSGR